VTWPRPGLKPRGQDLGQFDRAPVHDRTSVPKRRSNTWLGFSHTASGIRNRASISPAGAMRRPTCSHVRSGTSLLLCGLLPPPLLHYGQPLLALDCTCPGPAGPASESGTTCSMRSTRRQGRGDWLADPARETNSFDHRPTLFLFSFPRDCLLCDSFLMDEDLLSSLLYPAEEMLPNAHSNTDVSLFT